MTAPKISGQLALFPDHPVAGADAEGLEGVIAMFATSRRSLFSALCEQAQQVAAAKGSVTADDLRFDAGVPVDRRIVGAVLAHLSRKGILAKAFYTKTGVKGSHGRPIIRFVLAGEKQAAGQ